MNTDMSLIKGNGASHQGTVKIPVTIEASNLAEKVSTGEVDTKSDSSKGVNVTISQEGAQKQAAEAGGSEEVSNKTPADAAIAKIKEMIEQVKKQIDALSNDNSPEAKEKLKMLQGQLATLNASLMSAINKKNEIAQKENSNN